MYNTAKLFEQSKELITSKNLIFVEDVVALLGISKPTFYDHFPIDSNEFYDLRELLTKNKIDIKVSLRKKWLDSDNATLQMALYKLTSTPEEHKLLQQNYTTIEEVEKPIFKGIDLNVSEDNSTGENI